MKLITALLHRLSFTTLVESHSFTRGLELNMPQPSQRNSVPDFNRVITVAVNIPFDQRVTAEELAKCILSNQLPAPYAGHIRRLLGKLPLVALRKFCQRNKISILQLKTFFNTHKKEYGLRCPALESFFSNSAAS